MKKAQTTQVIFLVLYILMTMVAATFTTFLILLTAGLGIPPETYIQMLDILPWFAVIESGLIVFGAPFVFGPLLLRRKLKKEKQITGGESS